MRQTWLTVGKDGSKIRVIHGFGNVRKRRGDESKVILYLIGSQGREIYDTMAFEVPASERSLTQVLAAFDTHCKPKKNETVERFKFFSRSQDPGESQETFITDLKLLATTCNFGDLKDSLVRDRIICGIQDRQFREELLKISDLDLQRCLSVCRAAELSETRTKTLEEGEAVKSLKEQTRQVALEGLKGVLTIHDDILVFGEGSTEEEALADHDNNFHSLMHRCRECPPQLMWPVYVGVLDSRIT